MTQTLKQIRKSDLVGLVGLPKSIIEYIVQGAYQLFTIRGELILYLLVAVTGEKWVLLSDGAVLDRADNWTGWDDLEQACILIDG